MLPSEWGKVCEQRVWHDVAAEILFHVGRHHVPSTVRATALDFVRRKTVDGRLVLPDSVSAEGHWRPALNGRPRPAAGLARPAIPWPHATGGGLVLHATTAPPTVPNVPRSRGSCPWRGRWGRSSGHRRYHALNLNRQPRAAARRGDAALIQARRDLPQRRGTLRLEVGHDGGEIGRTIPRSGLAHRHAGSTALGRFNRTIMRLEEVAWNAKIPRSYKGAV